MINADFCCAGSLIAMGALLGKVSPVQLMIVTLFGVTLFAVEEYIILDLLHVSFTKNNDSTGKLCEEGKCSTTLCNLCCCAACSFSAEMLVAPWSFTPLEGTMV